MPKRGREWNQKHTNFYIPDLPEESDLMYTKTQDMQIKLN